MTPARTCHARVRGIPQVFAQASRNPSEAVPRGLRVALEGRRTRVNSLLRREIIASIRVGRALRAP
jgi:hypothetical protein